MARRKKPLLESPHDLLVQPALGVPPVTPAKPVKPVKPVRRAARASITLPSGVTHTRNAAQLRARTAETRKPRASITLPSGKTHTWSAAEIQRRRGQVGAAVAAPAPAPPASRAGSPELTQAEASTPEMRKFYGDREARRTERMRTDAPTPVMAEQISRFLLNPGNAAETPAFKRSMLQKYPTTAFSKITAWGTSEAIHAAKAPALAEAERVRLAGQKRKAEIHKGLKVAKTTAEKRRLKAEGRRVLKADTKSYEDEFKYFRDIGDVAGAKGVIGRAGKALTKGQRLRGTLGAVAGRLDRGLSPFGEKEAKGLTFAQRESVVKGMQSMLRGEYKEVPLFDKDGERAYEKIGRKTPGPQGEEISRRATMRVPIAGRRGAVKHRLLDDYKQDYPDTGQPQDQWEKYVLRKIYEGDDEFPGLAATWRRARRLYSHLGENKTREIFYQSMDQAAARAWRTHDPVMRKRDAERKKGQPIQVPVEGKEPPENPSQALPADTLPGPGAKPQANVAAEDTPSAQEGELGTFTDADGKTVTEKSVTLSFQETQSQWQRKTSKAAPDVQHGITETKFVNVPLMVKGQVDVEALVNGAKPTKQQIDIAWKRYLERKREGQEAPTFKTLKEATDAAQKRSDDKGRALGLGTPAGGMAAAGVAAAVGAIGTGQAEQSLPLDDMPEPPRVEDLLQRGKKDTRGWTYLGMPSRQSGRPPWMFWVDPSGKRYFAVGATGKEFDLSGHSQLFTTEGKRLTESPPTEGPPGKMEAELRESPEQTMKRFKAEIRAENQQVKAGRAKTLGMTDAEYDREFPQFEKHRKAGPIATKEHWDRFVQKAEKIPVLGSIAGLKKNLKLHERILRMRTYVEKSEQNDKDLKDLAAELKKFPGDPDILDDIEAVKFRQQQIDPQARQDMERLQAVQRLAEEAAVRGVTFEAQASEAFADTAKFMAEFWMGSGWGAVGRKAVRRLATAGMRKLGTAGMRKFAGKGLAQLARLAGPAAQGALRAARPEQLLAMFNATSERMLPKVFRVDGRKLVIVKEGMPAMQAFVHSLGESLITNSSEVMGEGFGRLMSQAVRKVGGLGRATRFVDHLRRWVDKKGDTMVGRLSKAAGWNGLLGEWFEEDAEGFLRAAFGIDAGDKEIGARMGQLAEFYQDKRQLLMRAVVLGGLGAGRAALVQAEKAIRGGRGGAAPTPGVRAEAPSVAEAQPEAAQAEEGRIQRREVVEGELVEPEKEARREKQHEALSRMIDRAVKNQEIRNRAEDLAGDDSGPILTDFYAMYQAMSPEQKGTINKTLVRPMGMYPGYWAWTDKDGTRHYIKDWDEAFRFAFSIDQLGEKGQGGPVEMLDDRVMLSVAFMDIMLEAGKAGRLAQEAGGQRALPTPAPPLQRQPERRTATPSRAQEPPEPKTKRSAPAGRARAGSSATDVPKRSLPPAPPAGPSGPMTLQTIDRLESEGRTDARSAELLRQFARADPSASRDTIVEISDAVRTATPEIMRAEGFSTGEGQAGQVTGRTVTRFSSDAVRTTISLYRGHDATTVVEEWYHRAYDRLSAADRGLFERYHSKRKDARDVHEHFAQDGRDFFFSRRLDRIFPQNRPAGRIRRLFERARESLRALVGRVRGLDGMKVPAEIERVWGRVATGGVGPAEKGARPGSPGFQVRRGEGPKEPKESKKPEEPMSALDLVARRALPGFWRKRRGGPADARATETAARSRAFAAKQAVGRQTLAKLHTELLETIRKRIPLGKRAGLQEAVGRSHTLGQLVHVAQRIDAAVASYAEAPEEKAYSTEEIAELVEKHEARGSAKGFRQAMLEKEATQADLVSFVQENLPLRERGKLLATVKNARKPADVEKARALVGKIYENWDRREAIGELKDLWKGLKVDQMRDPFPAAARAVMDEVAVRGITDKTREKLQATLDAAEGIEVAEFDDPDSPHFNPGFAAAWNEAQDRLDRSEKRDVHEMAPGDVRAVTNALQAILTQNALKNRLMGAQKGRSEQDAGQEAAGDLARVQPSRRYAPEGQKPGKRSLAKRVAYDAQMKLEQLALDLTDHEGAVAHQVLYGDIFEAERSEARLLQEAEDFLRKTAKKYGITKPVDLYRFSVAAREEGGFLAKQRTGEEYHAVKLRTSTWAKTGKLVGGVQLDLAVITDILATADDPYGRKQLLRGGQTWTWDPDGQAIVWTEEDLRGLHRTFGKWLAFAKDLKQWMATTGYDLADETFHEMNGYHLPRNERYWPLKRNMRQDMPASPFDYVTQPFLESAGWIKQRIGGRQPVILGDFLAKWIGHVAGVARYHSLGIPLRNARKLLGHQTDPTSAKAGGLSFQEELSKRMGRKYEQRLIETYNHIAGTLQYAPGEGEEVLGRLRPKLYKATLGLKPFVSVKQAFSYGMARFEIDDRHWRRGLRTATAMMSPLRTPATRRRIREMTEHSPMLRLRFEESGQRLLGPGRSDRGIERFLLGHRPEPSMGGIRHMDMAAIGGIWEAVKAETAQEHPTLETQSKKYWEHVARRTDQIVSRTQPVFDPANQSAWARAGATKPAVGLMTMYMSQRNQNVNIAAREAWRANNEVRKADGVAAKARAYATFARKMGWWALNSLVAMMAIDMVKRWMYRGFKPKRRRDREEPWEVAVGLLEDAAGQFYGGNIAAGVVRSARRAAAGKPAAYTRKNPAAGLLEDLGRFGVRGVTAARYAFTSEKVTSGYHKGEQKRIVAAKKALETLGARVIPGFVGAPVAGPVAIGKGIYRALAPRNESQLREAYQDLFDERVRRVAAGKPVDETEAMEALATTAAGLGMDKDQTEKFRESAVSTLRSKHAKQFFQAFLDGRMDKARTHARNLFVLDGKFRAYKNAVKKREDEGRLTKLQKRALVAILRNATRAERRRREAAVAAEKGGK